MPHCNQCEQDWEQRKLGGDPVQCPRCHRTDWREPKKGKNGKTEGRLVSENVELPGGISRFPRKEQACVSGPANPASAGNIKSPNGPREQPGFDAKAVMCPYTEYDPETGETYGCLLAEHSLKIKHRRGPAI
jgi:hypothetical protein